MLRRIISDLEKSGILITVKWRYGGIKLWKTPNKISTYDILSSIWEELWITDCTKWVDCDKHSSCTTTSLFSSLQTGFNSLLKMYTLDKIIK
jgi:DNA-binding IscR family transcriptional regulator